MPTSYKEKFLCILLSVFCQLTLAQSNLPIALKVGDTVPVQYMENLLKLSARQSSHLKGDPDLFILHFWDQSCKVSQRGIPFLDSLQYKFTNQFQLILVSPDKSAKVKQSFMQIRFKSKKAVIISEDSIFQYLFPHWTVPHHVWLNSKGKVLYITEDFNATAKNIQAVLDGYKLSLIPKQDDSSYSMEKPLWNKIEKIRHPVLRYSSTLTMRLPGISSGMIKIWDTTSAMAGIRLINVELLSLYKVAFSGRKNEFNTDNRIILDVRNPGMFKQPKDKELWNDWLPQNIYNYELYIPIKEGNSLYSIMQKDLSGKFGYIAKIENRWLKCLVLMKAGELPKSKGGPSSKAINNGIISIRNLPVSSLYNSIKYANSDSPLPLINEAGDEKIDADIEANLTNIVYLRKELQKIGLDLVEQERFIPMVVIHEMKNL